MNVAEEQTYNGWRNRATWLVNLWLTNDESYYEQLHHILTSFGDSYDQVEALEEWFRAESPDEASVWSDLIDQSICQVDWREIVENNMELAQ